MIIKPREKSILLEQLVALNRRLPAHHQMKEIVQSNLRMRKSGVRGEMEIDYPIRFLNEQEYLILHDLRLRDKDGFFQIDTLILCEKYILILEIKNWNGTIIFGENGQVIRMDAEQKEEGFMNPIPQAKLQQRRLRNWLNRHSSGIPIDYFVVISFPSTIVKSASSKHPIPDKIIHNNQLIFQIEALDCIYPSKVAKMGQLMKLAEQLKKAHMPQSIDVLEKYGIAGVELVKGVYCPKCNAVPMTRKIRKWWYCAKCQHQSVDAHVSALHDYKLLIGNKISNRGARAFLQLGSPDIARKILQEAGFAAIGTTSTRVYIMK
jgi:hypothetical protein